MGTFDIAYCISPKKNYDSMNFANFGATTRETSMPTPGQIKAKKKIMAVYLLFVSKGVKTIF